MRGYMMRIRNAHYNLRLTMGNMMAVKYMLKAKGIPQLQYLFSGGQYKPLLFLLVLKLDIVELALPFIIFSLY